MQTWKNFEPSRCKTTCEQKVIRGNNQELERYAVPSMREMGTYEELGGGTTSDDSETELSWMKHSFACGTKS